MKKLTNELILNKYIMVIIILHELSLYVSITISCRVI